MDIYSM